MPVCPYANTVTLYPSLHAGTKSHQKLWNTCACAAPRYRHEDEEELVALSSKTLSTQKARSLLVVGTWIVLFSRFTTMRPRSFPRRTRFWKPPRRQTVPAATA